MPCDSHIRPNRQNRTIFRTGRVLADEECLTAFCTQPTFSTGTTDCRVTFLIAAFPTWGDASDFEERLQQKPLHGSMNTMTSSDQGTNPICRVKAADERL